METKVTYYQIGNEEITCNGVFFQIPKMSVKVNGVGLDIDLRYVGTIDCGEIPATDNACFSLYGKSYDLGPFGKPLGAWLNQSMDLHQTQRCNHFVEYLYQYSKVAPKEIVAKPWLKSLSKFPKLTGIVFADAREIQHYAFHIGSGFCISKMGRMPSYVVCKIEDLEDAYQSTRYFKMVATYSCSHCKNDHKPDDVIRICGRCKRVSYCNETCQLWDWKTHKTKCYPQSLDRSNKHIPNLLQKQNLWHKQELLEVKNIIERLRVKYDLPPPCSGWIYNLLQKSREEDIPCTALQGINDLISEKEIDTIWVSNKIHPKFPDAIAMISRKAMFFILELSDVKILGFEPAVWNAQENKCCENSRCMIAQHRIVCNSCGKVIQHDWNTKYPLFDSRRPYEDWTHQLPLFIRFGCTSDTGHFRVHNSMHYSFHWNK